MGVTNYPYPDRGGTHWQGCYRTPGHHNCAVAEVDRLRAALTEAQGALEAINYGLAGIMPPGPRMLRQLQQRAQEAAKAAAGAMGEGEEKP